MLDRLLSEEMLDVGYSLLALQVTSPVRYSVLKALSCLPALALLLIPAPDLPLYPAARSGTYPRSVLRLLRLSGALHLAADPPEENARCHRLPLLLCRQTQPPACSHRAGLLCRRAAHLPDAPLQRPLYPALFPGQAPGFPALRHRRRPGHRRMALRCHAAGSVQIPASPAALPGTAALPALCGSGLPGNSRPSDSPASTP